MSQVVKILIQNFFVLYYTDRKAIRKVDEVLFSLLYYTKEIECNGAHYAFVFQVHIYICIPKLFTISTFLTLANLKIIKFHFRLYANMQI